MAGKTCQICGQKSGIYPLCIKHLELKQEGLVKKDEKTGLWYEVQNHNENKKPNTYYYDNEEDDEDILTEYENESGLCCICEEEAPYGKQCKNCYHETLDYKANIDKNRKASELREWYYNLKNSIYRQKDIEIIHSNCNKLIALAILCRDIHNDDSLISRVYKDIEEIIKANKVKPVIQQETQNYDFNKNDTSGQVKCVDGHWVENDLERNVDDILYSLRRVHVYAKKVNEITSRAVKSDWFIPVLSDTKGIYIELWGMETEDYLKNKKEKIALYKEEELPLIEIYRKDVTSDIALLKDNLETNINKLEKELRKKKY